MTKSVPTLFTIGHSNRGLDDFIDLLVANEITAIADVRSQPYSRYMPQFNRESLKASLRDRNIAYAFLGEELGARRSEDDCYVDGKARYELIERTTLFQTGLERLRTGAETHRIALMCAEKDPVTCHRTILIAKALKDDFEIRHVVSSNKLETHDAVENRLLKLWGMNEPDMFVERNKQIEEAYSKQAEEIAYVLQDSQRAVEG